MVARQLDVAEAFDTISHVAVARYLASLGPCREAHILLLLVTQAAVSIQLSGVQWTQTMKRGIGQGATYSAELYARIVDYHLTPVHMRWLFATVSALFLIAYADDLVLLACSCAQMTRMITEVAEVLATIGLQLSLRQMQVHARSVCRG